mgnify:CR=1
MVRVGGVGQQFVAWSVRARRDGSTVDKAERGHRERVVRMERVDE